MNPYRDILLARRSLGEGGAFERDAPARLTARLRPYPGKPPFQPLEPRSPAACSDSLRTACFHAPEI